MPFIQRGSRIIKIGLVNTYKYPLYNILSMPRRYVQTQSNENTNNKLKFNNNNIQLNKGELEKFQNYFNDLKDTIQKLPETVTSNSPGLVTLHKRLNLPKEFSYSVLSRCLTCRSSRLPDKIKNDPKLGISFTNTVFTNDELDNYGLNIFGKNLLNYYLTLNLMKKYPRLPLPILNAAIDSFINDESLANIGRSWGIEVENTSIIQRYLKKEPTSITLGKLRFFNNSMNKKDGINVILKHNFSETSAYSLAVKSIIAAYWATTTNNNTNNSTNLVYKFIEDHILSRKLEINKLFEFEQPTRELSILCKRENLIKPITRLLAESGRLSKNPVFIVGVFSGQEKLGEGFGSSLKEAKARAATDALLKWYCYETAPGYEDQCIVDKGQIIV